MGFDRRRWIPVLGAVAILLSLAGLVLAAKSRGRSGPAADSVPLKKFRAVNRGPATAIPGGVDLLELVRLPEDAILGDWGFLDRALVSPMDPNARVQISCIPPEEYDLTVRVTRRGGTNSLNLGLVVGGRQTMVALDGNDGATSWLFLLTEEGVPNPTMRRGRLLPDHQEVRIRCSVRKSAVRVDVDDQTVIDWTGDPYEAFLLPDYLVPNSKALLVGSWAASFRIDELVLTPVSGKPTLLR